MTVARSQAAAPGTARCRARAPRAWRGRECSLPPRGHRRSRAARSSRRTRSWVRGPRGGHSSDNACRGSAARGNHLHRSPRARQQRRLPRHRRPWAWPTAAMGSSWWPAGRSSSVGPSYSIAERGAARATCGPTDTRRPFLLRKGLREFPYLAGGPARIWHLAGPASRLSWLQRAGPSATLDKNSSVGGMLPQMAGRRQRRPAARFHVIVRSDIRPGGRLTNAAELDDDSRSSRPVHPNAGERR